MAEQAKVYDMKEELKDKNSEHIDISFKNLTYTVQVLNNKKDSSIISNKLNIFFQADKFQQRQILKNLSGFFPGGQMTAILGSSGAGKTSLLNILAQRIAPNNKVQVNGTLMANSKPYDSQSFATFASYVMQDDVLFATMTPREALQFVANLKFTDSRIKEEHVNKTIKELKLERCQHTMIGGAMIKGISGGERKRTSIAIELVSDPFVILLDEPTSGLDSFTAFIILNQLKRICVDHQKTVIFTIHQPSTDIYQLFDRIMLLVEGKFIYQGPRAEIINYFSSTGFKCPEYSNPMDYLMSIMHGESEINLKNYNVYFENYDKILKDKVDQEIQNSSTEQLQVKIIQTSYAYQVAEICRRSLLNIKRDPLLVKGRFFQTIFMALIVGGIYFGVGNKSQTYQSSQSLNGVLFFLCISHFMGSLNPVMIQFPAERAVFLREENAKLYTTGAYFLGKSSIEIPFLIFFPIIQELIAYWMIGFNQLEANIVVLHILIFTLQSIAGNSVGLMGGCVFTDVKVAAGVVPLFIMPLVLFSGFYKNQDNIMAWIGWIQYLSPMKYSFEAAVRNQSKGKIFTSMPDPVVSLGMTIGLWESILILVSFIIIFRVLAYIFLNLLKSKVQ